MAGLSRPFRRKSSWFHIRGGISQVVQSEHGLSRRAIQNLNLLTTVCRRYATSSNRFNSIGGKSKRKIPVGVLGSGRVASSVHIPNILQCRQLDLRWIVEDKEEAIDNIQRQYSLDVPFYSSIHTATLLEDKSLEAVFVFTPTPNHFDAIRTSLEAGKAVFCEKPAAESVTDIEILYETAEKVDRPLLIGFNRRFDPPVVDIRQMLIEGQLGKLQIAKLTLRDSPRPSYHLMRNFDSSGCNILSDLAVHEVDFLTWITQCSPPESIYVLTHSHDPLMAEIGEADASGIIIKYSCGTIALIDITRESSYGYDQRVELFGSKGMGSFENPRQSLAVKNYEMGASQKPLMYSFPQRFKDSFQNQLLHFVDCLEGKDQPLVTKEESILTALVIDAAIQSYRQKQAINFTEFHAKYKTESKIDTS